MIAKTVAVIDSCVTSAQLMNAYRYMRLSVRARKMSWLDARAVYRERFILRWEKVDDKTIYPPMFPPCL